MEQIPEKHRYLTQDEYASTYGADPADLAKVEAFAQAHGLVVVQTSVARRSVFLSGTAAAFGEAFGTTIENFEHEGGTYRGRTGALTVPTDLKDIIEGVFGIDDRPVAKPHFQTYRPAASIGLQAHAAGISFTPPQLANLYAFPTGLDGSGQCIALIELGGGYRKVDITAYFNKLGLPVPNVKTVRVDGGKNQPSTPDGPDGEVMLTSRWLQVLRQRPILLCTSHLIPIKASWMPSPWQSTIQPTSPQWSRSVGAVPRIAGPANP